MILSLRNFLTQEISLDKDLIVIVIIDLMQAFALDKGLFAMIIGPIIGIAVMKGYIDPRNTDTVISELYGLLGAIIAIVSIIGALIHNIEIHKIKSASPQQQTTVMVTPTN